MKSELANIFASVVSWQRCALKTKTRGVAAVILALPMATSVVGDGGAELKSEVRTTTTGQELLDLKKALESDAMSQQEYEAHRNKVLEGE